MMHPNYGIQLYKLHEHSNIHGSTAAILAKAACSKVATHNMQSKLVAFGAIQRLVLGAALHVLQARSGCPRLTGP